MYLIMTLFIFQKIEKDGSFPLVEDQVLFLPRTVAAMAGMMLEPPFCKGRYLPRILNPKWNVEKATPGMEIFHVFLFYSNLFTFILDIFKRKGGVPLEYFDGGGLLTQFSTD